MVKKSEGKTAMLVLRIRPSVKNAAVKRAKGDDRSLANYIEQLIMADSEKRKRR